MTAEKPLSARHDAFARLYVETGIASKAYREARIPRKGSSEKSIHEGASRLLGNPQVKARIAELRAKAAEDTGYTLAEALKEYEEARVLAMKGTKDAKPSASAAVQAVTGKAKLFGLVVEKTDNETRLGLSTEMREVMKAMGREVF